ncbi:hypothetical protein QNO09_12850 [Streptomyces sp. 378]|uniref:hypothetical protein n=1 Tax=Streptomyces sp. 378 TaxID=3049412 RepID=UPI0024C2A9E9|nr:hypothetical protein [Streptomyces sp. 378]MDK1344175.1 hypothetical protein [Streptomyces sp. 378]
MVKITEEQVRRAEVNAAEKEQVRDGAAAELAANPYSELCAQRLTQEARLAAQFRANATELRAAYVAQVEEEKRRKSRPELEKAAAGEIKAAGVELAERRRAVVEAVERAQEVLVGVLAAGVEYNAAVQSHADVLAAAGLDVRGGESGGVRTVLGRCVVKVQGREYDEVSPAGLGGWLVHRVVESRLGRFNDLVVLLQWVARAVEQDSPAVVAEVSAPGRVEQPRAPRALNAFQALLGSK